MIEDENYEARAEIVSILIDRAVEELEQARFQAWFYSKEAIKPVKVGKQEAEQRFTLYHKQVEHYETHIRLLEEYAKFLEKGGKS